MKQSGRTALALLATFCGNLIFGLTFLFSKIALAQASPLVVIADRYLVAFPCFTLVLLLRHKPLRLGGKNLLKLIAMSLCQPVGYFLCETYGIARTTSSFASVMIALIPVVTAVLGALVLHERMSLRQNVMLVISVLGVVLMVYTGSTDGTGSLQGVLLLFGAVMAGSTYTILSRDLAEVYTPLERTYMMVISGTVVFCSLGLWSVRGNAAALVQNFADPMYLGSLLFLGIAASIVAFFLLNFANNYLMAAQSTSFSSVMPVVSVGAGMLILHEHVSPVQMLAAAVIIFGVLGVQLMGKK